MEIGAGATNTGSSPSTTISAALGSSDHWAMGGVAIKPVGGGSGKAAAWEFASFAGKLQSPGRLASGSAANPAPQVNARPRQVKGLRMQLSLVRETGVIWRSYYFAGSSRIAMREDSDDGSQIYYILTEHLGSTSLTYRAGDGHVDRQWYRPWGEVRQVTGEMPTDYQYTGQRADSSIGMLWYGSRFYDAALGRFSQADSIAPRLVPQNIKNGEWLSLELTVDYAAPNMLYQMGLMYRERLLEFQDQESLQIIGQKTNTTMEDHLSQNGHKKGPIDQEYKTDEPLDNFQKLTEMGKLPRLELMNKRDHKKDKKGQPEPINPRLTLATFDRYSYTMNCPTGFIDPTGHAECDPSKVGGAVGIMALGAIITGLGVGLIAEGYAALTTTPITTFAGLFVGGHELAWGVVIVGGGVFVIKKGFETAANSGCFENKDEQP